MGDSDGYRAHMAAAENAAAHSPDPSTRNGAVLVTPHGDVVVGACNRFPRGVVESDERWARPAKYAYVEHAERNAVFAAARGGIRTDGLTMVSPWAACEDCARAIIQAGVEKLVRYELADSEWSPSIARGDVMLSEAGVEIVNLPRGK